MKTKLIYILLILFSVFAYGQVELSMRPDKTDYNSKEVVTLILVLELDGSELQQQTGFQLPDLSKFTMIGSGSVTNTLVDPETNTVIIQKITRIALEPKQKGKIKIGSVLVTVSNKRYKTEPFNIFVKDVERKSLGGNVDNDVYLNMEIEDREVYQDQPTMAVLRVYSKNIDNLRKIKKIHLPESDNINVHPIDFQKSEIDPSGIGNMPSQILGMFMIFPNESGIVEVPSVSASVSSYSHKAKIVSNKVKLSVKKLPEGAPTYFKNAVGNFKLDLFADTKEKIEVEKPINVRLRISGDGNLADMIIPKIQNSDDYKIFEPKITNHITTAKDGMNGYIHADYILIPKKAGTINITTEDFAFFNPIKKEYVNTSPENLSIVTFSHDEVLQARTAVEKVNEYTNTFLETVDSPVLKTTVFKVKEKKQFNWKVLFINLGILFALFIFYMLIRSWKKRKKNAKKLVQTSSNIGSVAETEKEIREKLKTDHTVYFSYLSILAQDKNYDQFFKTLEELDAEVRSNFHSSAANDFIAILERNYGNAIAEEYRVLSHNIQIEKYTPMKEEGNINELLKKVVKLYGEINK
ncbi:BatD family protein [Chryseobacterium sp.]|uniref:BatD family protein n=1 Tax=Chryseobacterium sp. TaxID=1871047 RepID=UPI003890A652